MGSANTTADQADVPSVASAGASLYRLTEALSAAGCRGRGSDWQCPAHEDSRESLSVHHRVDKTLITCHAGCDWKDVVAAAGISPADLYDAPRQRARSAPEWSAGAYGPKSYPYTDESGKLLYTVHRSARKEFWQEAADGSKSIRGVRRVLLLLPGVLAGIAAGREVHVVEGEKDVEALHRSGHIATCNSGGAKGWRDELADSLAGATLVTIWQDKDEPGREWARQVAASLTERSTPHRIVEALTGKDAWDHIAAGHAVEEAAPTGDGQAHAPGRRTEADERAADGRTRRNTSSVAVCADWLRDEIGRGALSGLFIRDGALVHTPRVGERGYVPPSEREARHKVHPGPAQVRPVELPDVKALVEVLYDCGKNEERKVEVAATEGDDGVSKMETRKEWRRTLFPKQAVEHGVKAAVLGYGGSLRPLHGVSHTPVLRPDGTVLEDPGYDDSTGLLYLPERGLAVPRVPDRPTSRQIRDAMEFILRPVAQFPFVTEDHRATWVGLMFTPLMRPILPPPYQFAVITATNPGSGKTLLADLIGWVHGRTMRGELPRDQEELRKAVTATLLTTTAPVAVFDNMTGTVRSSVLEALLTNADYSDRLLGKTRNLNLVNDRLWVATGNNAKIGGDLARRCVFIVIDPRVERPYLRTGFDITDLEGWMRENRGKYLAALLTVARGWVLAGSPADGDRSDSFAQWSGSLRGLLKWAGVAGSFGGGGDECEHCDSEDDAEWGSFLTEAHRVMGAGEFTARELLEKVSANGVRPETLPGDLAERWDRIDRVMGTGTAGLVKSLGKWLANREGRYADGYKVVFGPGSTKRTRKFAVVAPAEHEAPLREDAPTAEPAGSEDPWGAWQTARTRG